MSVEKIRISAAAKENSALIPIFFSAVPRSSPHVSVCEESFCSRQKRSCESGFHNNQLQTCLVYYASRDLKLVPSLSKQHGCSVSFCRFFTPFSDFLGIFLWSALEVTVYTSVKIE